MLSNRLKAIVSMVPKADVIADIGCDHGKAAVSLIKKNIAQQVICTDISGKSLDKAKKLVKSSGYAEKVSLREGNGLAVLNEKEADIAVVAGMGAELIIDILDADKAKAPDTLVLSCNTGSGLLRQWLGNNGYVIQDESLVFENRHFYPVILAVKGKAQELSEMQIEFGPVLLEKKPKTLKHYVAKRIDNAKEIKEKIEKSKTSRKDELIREIDLRLKMYSEVKQCLHR